MDDIANIVKGCIAWKGDSQDKLYRLFSRKMFGVCLYYSKDRTEAEDILQDGFIKIFENIKQCKETDKLEGWMRKVMVNTALERFRKQYYLYPASSFNENVEDISYDDVIGNMTAKEITQMIKEVSPQYRMVFNLYVIEGYSHKEISEMLGISEGTSKSNLSRAKSILQEKIKKYYDSLNTIVI